MNEPLHVLIVGPCGANGHTAQTDDNLIVETLPPSIQARQLATADAAAYLAQKPVDVVILYTHKTHTAVAPGKSWLHQLQPVASDALFLLATHNPSDDERQAALAAGFADYWPLTTLQSPLLPFLLQQAVQTNQLARQNSSLADEINFLNETQAQFIHDISHQLRNPLNSISLYLELLELGKIEKRGQYLDALNLQIKRLHVMIEDMVKIARLDNRQTQEEPGAINVNNLVRAVGRQKRNTAQALDVTIQYKLDVNVPPLHGRYHQLQQALDSLVDNAVKYAPAGAVQLTTRRRNAESVQISVRDDGIGIPPGEMPYIFEAYYRGRHPVVSETVGTGLGLVLAKKIIESHHGCLTIESTPDAGTTATITLPCNGSLSPDDPHVD